MIYPHYWYDEMKKQVDELRNPFGKNIFGELRQEILNNEETFSESKIGYALTGYGKLTNEGITYLTDALFKPVGS